MLPTKPYNYHSVSLIERVYAPTRKIPPCPLDSLGPCQWLMIYRLKFFCKFQSVGFYCLPHSLINVPFQRAGHPQFGPGGREEEGGRGREGGGGRKGARERERGMKSRRERGGERNGNSIEWLRS
jgi:hypothetical protein